MTVTGAAIADRLAAYTQQLRAQGAIRTEAVARAFATVPRHLFINTVYNGGDRVLVGDIPADKLLDRIYSDRSLMTHVPADEAGGYSSASQPSLVAKMIEALDLQPGMCVLEIGAGTGYNAALIATITGAHVVTLDVSETIVDEAARALQRAGIEHVTAVHGDGYLGHLADGPYDRVIVTCGVTGASPHWLDQLTPAGFALVPIAHGGLHPILAISRTDDGVQGRAVMSADFMTAAGPLYHWPANRVPTPTGAVTAHTLTTIPGAGHALDLPDYQALWFQLATHDPHTTRAWTDGIDPTQGLCALHHPGISTAWIQQDGAVRHTGDTALADDLTSLVTNWDNHGRPAITRWVCTLQAQGPDHEPVHIPHAWSTAK
jgi:protein-L-isoaspartate(D-aspartate) O-methyltransferase